MLSLYELAEQSTVQSIQRGTTTISTGGTAVVQPISNVDISKSIIYTSSAAGNCTATFNSSYEISVNCSVAGDVDWVIVEYGGK